MSNNLFVFSTLHHTTMSNRSIPLRNLSTKKPRVEEFNDLWDDDLDGDVIDDCFKRATQVCQEVTA